MANTLVKTTPPRFITPAIVVSHFHVRRGDSVADFGAGGGAFEEVLTKLVGPEGQVYACDIQRCLIEKIGALARRNGLTQLQTVWGDIEMEGGCKIPSDTLDVGIMVDTFFQFTDRETALREVVRTLRPGGKFFVIDWSESFGGIGPLSHQVVDQDEVIALCETVGFVFERTFDAGDYHYGLGFRKV